MTEAVTRWIRQYAYPVTTFAPQNSVTDLRPLLAMVGDARVVALGVSGREAHELSAVSHRILRLLVEEAGFRSLALEGDDPARVGLDAYVRTGVGDPRALLAGARSFWRTGEILDVVRWMRAHNVRHPDDPVRFAGIPARPVGAAPVPDGLAGIERTLADNTLWWHERTGDKIVYWGGLAHTANGDPRTVSPSSSPTTHRNAGGHLRERWGSGYVSVGLTFDHGAAPGPIPAPPDRFAEAVLGGAGLDAYFLDLRAESPAPVRTWLAAPTRARLLGPGYDPADDAAHHMAGGSLGDWFDIVVHVREVAPVRLLAG
ncbi:erythromycin esterase family protein [Streptomyces sp. NPDC020965]|uniref:erythromycin esterase family protein n=1 Tax=Streptomyces sp. NPDC020965 TaxID=3365105 RepID=UPI0037A71CD4